MTSIKKPIGNSIFLQNPGVCMQKPVPRLRLSGPKKQTAIGTAQHRRRVERFPLGFMAELIRREGP